MTDPSLAISSYAGLGPLTDTDGELNLAWTSDERARLDLDLTALVRDELGEEIRAGLPDTYRYPVTDPYGEAALGPSVAAYFGLPAPPPGLTCGPGVGPLLNGLARLARGGRVGVLGHVYPDFPFWVRALGGACLPWRPGQPCPDVLFLERPALLGHQVELAELRELCERVAGVGGLVVVDESNANYCPPAFSAVPLAGSTDNLVVLRGLSKAYGLGGLRVSYCVAGSAAVAAVRAGVAPLLTSTLSLRIGGRVLAAGDITAGLRSDIAVARTRARALLAGHGVEPAPAAAEPFPYLLFADADGPARLAAAGVRGKRHLYWNGAGGQVFRLSVPLLPERMAELARRLGHRHR